MLKMAKTNQQAFDKHGFIKKRSLFKSVRLFLRAALTVAVCGYAFHRCSMVAHADTFRRLTIEQTLALYGTEFDIQYYRVNQNDTISAKAVFCGSTSDFSPRSFINSLSFKSYYFYDLNTHRALTNEDFADGGLVYAVIPSYAEVSDYTNGFDSWQQSSTGDHANISIDFPITFHGISRFVQPVFWTIGSSNIQAERSSYIFTSTLGMLSNTACRSAASGTLQARLGMGQMSLLNPAPATWSDVPERLLQNVACLFADLGNPDLSDIFDITGIHYSLNNVYGVPCESSDSFGRIAFSPWVGHEYDAYTPFIVIGRPALYGYNPPVVTTTAPVTTPLPAVSGETGATYTQQTVDLSNLESGVAAIVQQEIYNGDTLDWIGENQRRAVNNLATIIDQLNAIYAKMWSDGEINADSGLEPPAPEVLQSFVSSALAAQSGTTTYILSGIFAPYFGIGASFAASDTFLPWVYVGGFVMVFAVVCWFVFYGRKG